MTRALLIAMVLSSVGGTVCAQPANGRVTGSDPCFQLSRAAAEICHDPANGAVKRLDCERARTTLLECMKHTPPGMSAGSAPSETPAGTSSSGIPSGTIPPQLPPSVVSPNQSTGIGSPNSPYGAVPSKKPSTAVLPDKPTGTVAPEMPTAAGLVGARSANESMTGLESCFQVARIADAICSKLPNDPAQRLDCFQKTRSAQLECLEHVLSETPAGPTMPKTPSETTRLEPPATAALPEGSSERVSPGQPGQTGTVETPAGIPSAQKSNTLPKAIVRTSPPELPGSSKAPAGTIRPDISPKAADVPVRPTGTNWVVSETTSPIDYSPLVTALIGSTSPVKDAPTTLVIRCRGQHTELLVRTEGTWRASRYGEIQVGYQINDQPAVRLPWAASGYGKIASYKGEVVGLLQSLPEGARLKIDVLDGPGLSHEATFQLAGLDAVRKKIAVACKWAPVADKTLSASFKTNSATIASRTALSRNSLEPQLQPAGNAAADSDATRANTTDSRATDGAVPSSTTRTIQEQVAAATAVAERMTVAILVPAPEPKANDKDRSDHSETLLHRDAEKTAPAQPNKTELLVYLLMARPEIKSVSDLTSRIIAIDGHSASNGDVRIAIAAAGASEVQLSNSQTKAIDRVISGEVSAAVLTLVSPEAAEGFPEIAGFKIFRIPLSPR
jgi:hypothetical protein